MVLKMLWAVLFVLSAINLGPSAYLPRKSAVDAEYIQIKK